MKQSIVLMGAIGAANAGTKIELIAEPSGGSSPGLTAGYSLDGEYSVESGVLKFKLDLTSPLQTST